MVDSDTRLERRAGATIREVLAAQGETAFRTLECEVVREIAALDHHVISTGGGVVLREENVAALKEHGKLVWLTAAPEVLWERILQDEHRRQTRPAPDLATGLQQIRAALQQRNPIYEKSADLIVETQDRSVEDIVEEILSRTGLGLGA